MGPGSFFLHTYASSPSLGSRVNDQLHRAALQRTAERLHLDDAVALVMCPDRPRRLLAVAPWAQVCYVEHVAPARLEQLALDPTLADISARRIEFIGRVDERLDVALLAGIAGKRP